MVHLLWVSDPETWRMTTMKRDRHRPEAVRKLQEGERLLNEGKEMTEVLRHLEIAEST